VNVPNYGAVKLNAIVPEGKKGGDCFRVKVGDPQELAEQKKLEGIKAYKFGRVLKARSPSSLLSHAQSCFLQPCSTFLSPVLLSRLLLAPPPLVLSGHAASLTSY